MLKDRLLIGIPFGLLGLLAFVLPGLTGALLFIVLSSGFIGLVLAEFFQLYQRLGFAAFSRSSTVLGMVWIAVSGILMHWLGSEEQVINALWQTVPVLFLLFLLIRTLRLPERKTALAKMFASFTGFLFILTTLGMLPQIYFWSAAEPEISGRILALYIIVVTKMGDIGGYTVGMLTGRRTGGNHKMMPVLSPGKSWEGLAGGIAGGIAAALAFTWPREALFGFQQGGNELVWAAIFGLLCTIAGLLGDVLASLLKRAAEVKDSGRIPGFGGALDIFDSLIFTIPLFYIFLYFTSG